MSAQEPTLPVEMATLARVFMDGADLGIVGLDAQRRVVLWNAWIATRTGISEQAARGRALTELFPDMSPRTRTAVDQVYALGQPRLLSPALHTLRLPLAASMHQIVRVLPLHDAAQGIVGVLILIQDVSGLLAYEESAESELRRTNRALRVLSDCNQAVIRADDEASLLDAVCRIIVQKGGYRLAWVGFAQPDEARTVRPVAQAGFEDGYLDRVKITWGDDEWGQGPTGRAIRSGEPVVVRNILTEPNDAPWREEAVRRGYRAFIALPLVSDGQPFGALNIYAAEPDAFDEQEIKLLSELADDLAYGLDALRNRAERALAEQALRESERHFRDLYENAPNAYFSVGGDGCILGCNRRAEELLGYTAEEMVERPVLDLYADTPFGKEKATKVLERFRAGESIRDEELQMQKADGSFIWVSLTVNAVRDAQGRIVESRSMIVDITERKRAELALQAQVQRTEQLLNTTLDGYLLADTEGQIVDVNPAYCRLVGYSRDELLQMNIEQLEGQLSPEEIEQRIAQMVRQGGARFETRHRRKDGQLLDLEASITIVQPETRPLVAAFVRDVTERRLAEEEIRQRNRELTALNRLTHRVIASLSVKQVVAALLEEVVAAAEPELALLFLRQGEDLILQGVAPDDSPHRHAETPVHRMGECLCGLAVREGRPLYSYDIHCDARCTWDECKRAGLRSLAALPLYGGQEVIGVLAVASSTVRDFETQAEFLETLAAEVAIGFHNAMLYGQIRRHAAELEQRVAERTAELQIARDKAQEADRLKSVFLATMSHELRTLLNSIIGFTGILLQGLAGPFNAEQTKQLGMVQRSARHLLALINDVLDISKIEAGQLEIVKRPFDLRTSVENVVASVRPLAEKKGLALTAEIAPDVTTVNSDRRRVEQVLLNLMNNAVKFTAQGEVSVRVARAGQMVRIQVTDTGVGIRQEEMVSLFKPFQQIESGLSRPHEGTGLGLSICKRLVTMLGGEITVESEWGQGSTFAFTLPG